MGIIFGRQSGIFPEKQGKGQQRGINPNLYMHYGAIACPSFISTPWAPGDVIPDSYSVKCYIFDLTMV